MVWQAFVSILMVWQAFVPPYEIITLVGSFVFVNWLLPVFQFKLLLADLFFFPFPHFTKKIRFLPLLQNLSYSLWPLAFSDKSGSYITCCCLYHGDTFCVTADTKIFLGWWVVVVWKYFAFMTWTHTPGYANGIRLARLNQCWFWNRGRNNNNSHEEIELWRFRNIDFE